MGGRWGDGRQWAGGRICAVGPRLQSDGRGPTAPGPLTMRELQHSGGYWAGWVRGLLVLLLLTLLLLDGGVLPRVLRLENPHLRQPVSRLWHHLW